MCPERQLRTTSDACIRWVSSGGEGVAADASSSRKKLLSVNYRHGVPQIKAKPLRFFPCNKGIEYCYSLSKQGLSYVRWLNQSKPQEDISYLTMLGKVMQALPENLRYALGFSGLIRSSHRYHGPTRQLRLLDNTANPLIHVVVSHFDLQRETLNSSRPCSKKKSLRRGGSELRKAWFNTWSPRFSGSHSLEPQ